MDSDGKPDGIDTDYPELPESGLTTFLKTDRVPPTELTDAPDVGIVGVPFDTGVIRNPGARFGPRAIREASAKNAYFAGVMDGVANIDSGRVVDFNEVTIVDCGDTPTNPTNVEQSTAAIMGYVERVAAKTMPVVLGGDHYISYPSFLGYAQAVDDEVGIVHLDADSDATADSPYGDHTQATQFSLVHETEYGNWENHAMLGLRGYEPPRVLKLAREEGLYYDNVAQVREKGIRTSVREAVDHVTESVDHVYVSVDIDVVDPAFAPGTGGPKPGGLTSTELITTMEELGTYDSVGAIDLVEVAPQLDPTTTTQRESTALLAQKGILRFIESAFL